MNPAAMQVYEMTYQPSVGAGASQGQERYIPFVSEKRFRNYTAGYQQRLGWFGSWPNFVTQRFGLKIIDMSPGTANSWDTMWLTICPSPLLTNVASYPTGNPPSCNFGGIMNAPSDIPILNPDYHQALVEGAALMIAKALDKKEIAADCQTEWERYVQEAIDFGSSVAEGDAEQAVSDYYGGQVDSMGPI